MELNSGKATAAPRLTMALAALGVVYGDLGTSPLYAFRQCFRSTANGVTPTPENVLGTASWRCRRYRVSWNSGREKGSTWIRSAPFSSSHG